MILGLLDSGPAPALERLVSFTAARHAVITDNIANLDTPHYRPQELDPAAFQDELARTLAARRVSFSSHAPPAQPAPRAVPAHHRGTMRFSSIAGYGSDATAFSTRDANRNLLFHDRNNRDLERTMQDLAENTLMHNMATDLLRTRYNLIQSAIRERP